MKFNEATFKLSESVARHLSKRYGIPLDTAQLYAFDVVCLNQEKVVELIEEKPTKAFNFVMDKTRRACGIHQITNEEGNRVWNSHFLSNITVNVDDEEDSLVPDVADANKLEFLENIEAFKLSKPEQLFIHLTFAGYYINEPDDHPIFQEAFPELSIGYLQKSFFDNICKKLKKNSPFRKENNDNTRDI